MRKNFGAKPWTYPQPVLMIATYGEDGTPDVMNAAWGGISDDTQISICVSADHKTTENILARKAFTVSMAEYAYIKECDYAGIVSGNDVPDKFEKAGFHAEKSEFVDAPISPHGAGMQTGKLRSGNLPAGRGDRQCQCGRECLG